MSMETNKDEIKASLIEEFIRHCADIFPYDDPNYNEKLMSAAEHYANEVMNPNSTLNCLCKEHDEQIDDNSLEELLENN